jgi:hypothetical protein
VITDRIPRSTDLLAASHCDLGRSLRHKLGMPSGVWMRSSEVFGLWIRSPGPLAGRWGFWQVGSTWQGPPGPWSVGTHGYPCLSSPRSTCRCSGWDKVMLRRSEDMVPVRSRRVHGDPKKKILLSVYEGEHEASGERVQGLEVKITRCHCLKNRRPNRNQVRPTHLQGRFVCWTKGGWVEK